MSKYTVVAYLSNGSEFSRGVNTLREARAVGNDPDIEHLVVWRDGRVEAAYRREGRLLVRLQRAEIGARQWTSRICPPPASRADEACREAARNRGLVYVDCNARVIPLEDGGGAMVAAWIRIGKVEVIE